MNITHKRFKIVLKDEFKGLIYLFRSFSNKSKKDWVLPSVIFVAMVVWITVIQWPDDKLHVWFFNVGQGDAIFVKTPDNRQFLIDGGPDRTVLAKLSRVMPYWDWTIDAVFVTHPHADHITGLIEVLKRYQVNRVFINPTSYESPVYRKLLDVAKTKEYQVGSFLKGDKLKLQGGEIESFWPPGEVVAISEEDINRTSMVLRLQSDGLSVLFTGDAELAGQIPGLNAVDLPQTDILKVPHQGSAGAIDKRVLRKLQPSLAIISVGRNTFGHPSKQTLEVLSAEHLGVLRTDSVGDVEIMQSGTGNYQVITEY